MPDDQPTTPYAAPEQDAVGAQPHGQPQRWLEDAEPLPPRPRRRLLTPLPLALAGVLLIACGFIGGVLVEKGQSETGSTAGTASGFASRLRSLAGAAAGGSSTSGSGAQGSGSGFVRPTEGTVAYISGDTIYVTNTESNTVKVRASAATSVTKTVTSAVKDIHPGETVTITGSTAADGTVSAESIRVGSAGGGLAGLFAGASGSGGSSRSSSTSSSSTGPALFGSG